ncbi:MAG: Four helix bundle protein [Candidatus Woesebacteria bacterium GW2011_GWA1_39_21]|uniref:Four helix bundle protein n=1 Tax=Candidatus Woesebacteria bacterium GW2011_GWA1_39_21 TaxID=1618550 RepID=A0A0G0QLL1_9BACT|nr:MAG: Four helix bundle protein [Candidatus Woesebacteria bacterium GW2011_GWA1_39_21]
MEECKSGSKYKFMQDKQSYKKLIVYQKSKELVLFVYEITREFPKTEEYVLLPQMRRAVVSIMANIVEGYAKSRKELIRFLSISIGSLTELEVYLDLCLELNYLKQKRYDKGYNLLIEVKKLLYGFQKSLRNGV